MAYKILITSLNNLEGHWVDVTTCSQKEFLQEVKRLFGEKDSYFFVEDAQKMIPFEFHHAGVGDQILTDSFWDWRNYSEEDQKLLVKYIEITGKDDVTLKEAKDYFSALEDNSKVLHFKDGRILYHYIKETGRVNCTLEEAKEYYKNLAST